MSDPQIARDALRAVFSETKTRPECVSRAQTLMGGRASVMLVGGGSTALTRAFALADRCEQLWSRFLPDSDVTRLNWAEGRAIEVDPLTVRLITAMIDAVALTSGDYDPTLLPDLVAAGYTASVLDPDRVTSLPQSARAPGNLRGVVIDGTTVRMPLGTTIDPGGIGKGLTADLVCEDALAGGAWGALAEIGGDVVVAGQAPDEVAWRLGVENPLRARAADPDSAPEHSAIVRLASGSLVTSSQRKRRWSTSGGERHHLISPRTHDSALTSIQTVSVIAATGARAESLTKPGFLRDTIEYLAWLPTVGAAGLVIDDTGTLTSSANWKNYS
ncbi:hypothetical protein JF66_11920 [Cryobacterium sp. MLB-32]|uniref:FAD:protein FMN transferase n=1 Tax=Cryobacterium sp. MLB-32 TaxID=1529318 RepID=UPI0004E6FA3C|nr:FAD:protein FMN transferase [Cryobacterium sp. MLB-32]KFF59360.1 hypothetical protein JF66_11920 [Cryobacterium sp. MLB-32]